MRTARPKLPKFREFPVKRPLLGLYLDPQAQDIPTGGFRQHTNFHVFNDRIQKYPGWALLAPVPNIVASYLPILHPLDPTTGIFPLISGVGFAFQVAGVPSVMYTPGTQTTDPVLAKIPTPSINLLPLIHPNDNTTGVFPTINPIGMLIQVAGVPLMLINNFGRQTDPLVAADVDQLPHTIMPSYGGGDTTPEIIPTIIPIRFIIQVNGVPIVQVTTSGIETL